MEGCWQKGCGLAEAVLARRKPGRMAHERANSDKPVLKVTAEGLTEEEAQ